MGNDVSMSEMAFVFEKRLKYALNDFDLREMGNGLKMWKVTLEMT